MKKAHLSRYHIKPAGIIGVIDCEEGPELATLEHAYINEKTGSPWEPKVAPGEYICTRHAPNRLPYETFELKSVPDFQGKPVAGILIHIGNYNQDSDGCILVGMEANIDTPVMLTNSKAAFGSFMAWLAGEEAFTLTIS